MNEHNAQCPLCSQPVEYWERYPGLLCEQCSKKTTDKHGKLVSFHNESISGGCLGVYQDNEEPYENEYCYVDGVKCIADEHRFGGIVIQVASAINKKSIR
jgi:predicted amidophosphoribosyltransferase